MKILHETLHIETRGHNDMIDLTERISVLLSKHKLSDGHAVVFVPGSTAGVTTIEFEPGLRKDFADLMERVAPRNIQYHHEEIWNDGNGHAHVRASLVGPSITIPFAEGRLMLGTWQQVVLVDFDIRPRTRPLIVQFIGE
ncbi:MAG: secondary thiamine-phosphate synthase enzyme YjbQ [Bacteroidota bacterium]|nr:secondary thiamine-phosphate synthase enzyme YjbQ [Bacteroidota bacterium]